MMMNSKYIVVRDVTTTECSWLIETVVKGTVVTETVDMYGCCTTGGVFVKCDAFLDYSFELPKSSVEAYVELAN